MSWQPQYDVKPFNNEPVKMLKGMVAFCVLVIAIQTIIWTIDDLKWLLTQLLGM
jgi:hypothetical protein